MTTENSFAPYAPGKSVIGVIQRYRDRNLPDPLTADTLEQIGISPTMVAPTLVALRFLALISEDGYRQEAFERLKRATTDEYPNQLAEIVRNAYLPVFTVVDPAEDSDIAVADAFRRYEPSAQRDKMVRLFRALCIEAGIIEEKTRRQSTPSQPRSRAPRSSPSPRSQVVNSAHTTGIPSRHDVGASEDGGLSTDYRLISAIIQQLPKDGKWSSARRERWISAMTSAVDLLIQIEDSAAREESDKT